MQTVWRGTISFGLVAIPVRLHAATEEHSISFRQVHAADGGRIRYRRVCEKDGEEIPYSDIAKGYETSDGDMIVLTDEDFRTLPLPTSRTIDVLRFIPVEQADPLQYNRGYYVRADAAGAKPYVLLRQALEESDRVAVVKIALRNRESLAMLRPRGDVLVLHTMLWPDEIRSASGIAPEEDVGVRPQELAMATSLIDTLTGDFHPEDYTDDYHRAVEELVAAKAEGHEPAPVEAGKPEGKVVDLMAALQASIDAAKGGGEAATGKGEAAGGGGRTTRRKTASSGTRRRAAGDAEEEKATGTTGRGRGRSTGGGKGEGGSGRGGTARGGRGRGRGKESA